MLITLGLGSAVGFISAVTTTLYDSFPTVDQKLLLKISCLVGKHKPKKSQFKKIYRTISARPLGESVPPYICTYNFKNKIDD